MVSSSQCVVRFHKRRTMELPELVADTLELADNRPKLWAKVQQIEAEWQCR
jgi:hypothetical protein